MDDLTLEKLRIDERLRSIELQVTRLVAHAETEAGNVSNAITNIINGQIDYKQEFKEHKLEFNLHKQEDSKSFSEIKEYIAKARGMLIVAVAVVGTLSTAIIAWVTSIKH